MFARKRNLGETAGLMVRGREVDDREITTISLKKTMIAALATRIVIRIWTMIRDLEAVAVGPSVTETTHLAILGTARSRSIQTCQHGMKRLKR